MNSPFRRQLPWAQNNIALILIAINVALFFLGSGILPGSVGGRLTAYLAMNPVLTVRGGYVWQPFTYMFAHASISHLTFNMLGLFFFGTQVERAMGSWEFLLFYLVSGLVAGLVSLLIYWVTGAFGVYLLGASGAVFAVLLAFATYYPDADIFVFGLIPIRAPILVLVYTGIELFSQMRGGTGVAHLTHLAGFGAALAYFPVRQGINPLRRFF